ncbi:YggS family pyridoxal phosphate-dependent enzyme [Klenkia sp. PcliD-1-E]|uniref:YggS family pyridoxal phosphate-dependent enzyme n=1 Tax=Klenkia sp. PcliD-1-E TaxID=2954492 RepID=UPI002097F845|nr:YggS family pyridoxal phosphate-dependent enzyme [Klenkia sp. PcliD-1-E]MCO7221576.1 YggS family pyridoxal phosphate-dependent enzyme [Klenkia sp. PcliD-1-E]
MSGPADPPAGSLADSFAAVRQRIADAARAAGRDPSSVALLAVSKTRTADAVAELAALGQREFAENKVQELVAKAEQLADLGLRWHLVGQLQRNKATAVVGVGAVVQSVDRVSLVERLAGVAERAGTVTEVFVQVDLGGPEGVDAARGGLAADLVPELADAVAERPALRLRGLMAVAPRGEEPGPAFARLAELADRVRRDHPGAVELSAGMSGDLEQAIAAGATTVRVGTALFGPRPLASGAGP